MAVTTTSVGPAPALVTVIGAGAGLGRGQADTGAAGPRRSPAPALPAPPPSCLGGEQRPEAGERWSRGAVTIASSAGVDRLGPRSTPSASTSAASRRSEPKSARKSRAGLAQLLRPGAHNSS